MNLNDIPVRVVGPGSQPSEDDGQALSYMSMPNDMSKYERPQVPEDLLELEGAKETMNWLRAALARFGETSEALVANLNALDNASRDVVNQILGEGEVSITYDGALRARIQESVMAGIWRTLYLDADDVVLADVLEVADVPRLVRSADGRDRPLDTSAETAATGVMNALPILVELDSHLERFVADGTRNTINLSLLPLSDEDVEFLDQRLGRGPVDILSRAYGKCQVISTCTQNVWWVRYYNSMSTLILNTLEVAEVPEVVCAAPEDLRDSAERLEEILAPYRSEVA